MIITEKFSQNWQIVRFQGKFVAKTLNEVRKTLSKIESEGKMKKVVFDLSSTNYLDSSALTVMLNLLKRLNQKEGGEFVVCGPNKEVMEIFSIVGFDKVVRIYPSVESVLNQNENC
ncbi:hypothetical protein CHISP_1439 [Chitinispirillum alkaliphilum]|nr:hypothetical protein CHISP_1439 [Chitinispirillum alkaliphilum]